MENLFLQTPSTTTLLGTVGILLALYIFFPRFDPQRKEPPGPKPLLLFGNLLQLDPKSPHSTLCKLSKKYGPVFTFHFGPKKVVVLAGYKTIKQALVNNDAFSERDILPIINDLKLTHGIVFANGDSWKEMRHFALTNLKVFGMGRKACEEKIIEESQHLIHVFNKKDGKAFDTTLPVSYAASNIICSIVYGKRFEYDDPVFRSMVDRSNKNTQLLGSPSVQESGNVNSHYCEDNLLVTVVNLFTAGIDTTSSTIRYGLLLTAKYPKIQDQVQEELSRVVGSRQIRVEDRKNLPYTDAVIHEIQRMANVVPSTPYRTSRDVTFQGYFIKKGTPVFVLLSSVLQDEDEWEKPYTFNPDHFLDKDGNFRKRDAFLPFSAGSRACVGESLGRVEVFLFFTSLLQHFRFTPPPGVTEDELDLTQVGGFSLTPSPHELCAISRI